MPSSEIDPLLPRNQSAPEISGYGFSKSAEVQVDGDDRYQQRDDDERESRMSEAGPSPLRTIIGLFTIVVAFSLVISFFVPEGLGHLWDDTFKKRPQSIEDRVDQILSETPLIDGHNDLAIMIRFLYGNKIYEENFTQPFENGGMPFHVDLPRLKAGKVGGSFWSAYANCPKNGTDFSDDNYAEIVATTYSQIDMLRRLTASYPKVFSDPSANSSTALAAFQDSRKLVSPIGIEGLHQVGNSFSNLRLYESLGARYSTLTHNCHNIYADAALTTNASGTLTASKPLWTGVSEKGQQMIREMNRIGMLVDISHTSVDTMLDILGGRPEKWGGSRSPVIFSHSSAYSICSHPRNVPDKVLKLVKKTNSLVMVNFAPDFISCFPHETETGIPDFDEEHATLHQVAKHITHIGDLIGYEHVGIGSDFDGIFSTPRGLEDVSYYPALISELLHMGVTDEQAALLVGQNVLRVWGDAEKTSVDMHMEGVLPAEDSIETRRFE